MGRVTTAHALIAFSLASCLLTITPGLDTMLVLRTAAVSGSRGAIAAAFGICIGLLTWGLAASLGIGIVLSASRVAYNLLRIAGACYLVFLGCRSFVRSGSPLPLNASPAEAQLRATEARLSFTRGLLTNLLNPKVGMFYVSFLPMFIPKGVNVVAFSMILAGIHAFEGIVWFAALISAVKPLSNWLRKIQVQKTINRVAGVVFVGFGLRLMFEDN